MIQYLLKGESTSRLKVQSLLSQQRYHNVFYNVKMSMSIYLFYLFLQHLSFNVFSNIETKLTFFNHIVLTKVNLMPARECHLLT